MGVENASLLSLSNLGSLLLSAADLRLKLLVNESEIPFLTSDTPTVRHNRYCEGPDPQHRLGYECSGIQIFLPLSPRHVLHAYDSMVYSVGRQHAEEISLHDQRDVTAVNRLQVYHEG